MEPKSPSKMRIQITGLSHNPKLGKFIIVSFSIIFIVGIVGTYLILKDRIFIPEKMNTYFTVVLDCGSTGTRVNVFEWITGNGSKIYGNLPVLLHSYPDNLNKSNGCEYHCMQAEPGLHNFVNNAYGVRASLEPLIRYAEERVPLERRSTTPIFILATAGMRRLVVGDATRVLEDVKKVVKEHGFLYRKSWIRVLSGKEEAYYGWIALNYKMGIFESSSRLSTLGLLDLGGSSLQVVAEVNVSMKDDYSFSSKIGPVEHDLVAYSLPAFGLNEAFDRTIVMLSHTQELRENVGGMFKVKHPCLGSGFVQNYTCSGCFGVDYRVSGNLSYHVKENVLNSVLLVGAPNWEQCEMVARAAAINSSSREWSHQLNRSKCVGLLSCGGNTKLNLTKTLQTVSRYHALSGFFAVYQALSLSERANLTMLWELGEKLCSGLWADHKNINGKYCFRVPYLTSLIENALCLNDIEIIFGPGDVSWTLGASLIEGELLWHHAEKKQNRLFALKDDVIRPSPLLTFVLLLSLLVIVYYCQIKFPMVGRRSSGTRTALPSYLCTKRQRN